MTKKEQTPHVVEQPSFHALHPGDQELIPGTPTIARSILHTVVVKDEDIFFLAEPDGCVPLESAHGFGLYYHDCRFLNGYELRIGGRRPEQLVWTAQAGFMAVLGLTNPDIRNAEGSRIDKHSIEIKWVRLIDGDNVALYDVITFHNLTFRPVDFPVSLTFLASFEDVFAIRGMPQERRGYICEPTWENGSLNLSYKGADKIYRSVTVHFSPSPIEADGTTAGFNVRLQPRESKQILVSLSVAESRDLAEVQTVSRPQLDLERVESALRRTSAEWLEGYTQVRSDSLVLNKIMDRSLRDLGMLRSYIGGDEYFAAGVPWFAALFGRDSIITSIQTLAFNPGMAEHTIRLLAGYQGKRMDEWREEEPGKILHELRVGEMANLGEVPHTPYYGTIDATPLFLILVASHAAWTGDLTLFSELRSNVEAALEWIARYGDINADGYVQYMGNTGKGLINQGWKDSFDAIVNVDGSLAAPPIALVEVQAYVYQAKVEMAALFRRAGDVKRADLLEAEAGQLRRQFNKDFWVDKGFYALALQAGNRQAAVMSSNAGQALWTGIADEGKARLCAEHLLGDDMFNGWGIRTLSANAPPYNPMGYHLGTVWPHDNSLIVAGLRRYGCDAEALRVFVGLVEAAVHFDASRLPELFAGFSKQDYSVPVSYPVACQPQAWAAGAVPYMLITLLGVLPEAFENRLRVRRPMLPSFVNQLEIHHMKVGRASIDLKFERTSDSIAVKILKLDGPLDVVVELSA